MRAEIAKKVRSAWLQSRTTLSGVRAGTFRVHATGSGYDFDQLSEYYEGGDFRRIDWKSSARTNSLLLREYKDEQNRTIHIMMDVSASMRYGTTELLVSDVAHELAQALEIIGDQAEDMVVCHAVDPSQTPWKSIFEHFSMRYRRRSLLFVLSDFIMSSQYEREFQTALRILAHHHEVVMVRVRDRHESLLFSLCDSFMCKDSEIDHGGSKEVARQSVPDLEAWRGNQAKLFTTSAASLCDCYTGDDDGAHIDALVSFLKKYG